MASLQLDRVHKRFGATEVIGEVSLDIPHREFMVLVGPSGCGKSTLLRLISGLEDVSGGRIRIGDRDVTAIAPSKRNVAMVFQSYALFPHMTVAENIGFGLTLARVAKPERARRVAEAARILQIEPLLDRKPRQLSGGQRQRVAIGRSIIRNPEVFLFDEPLSNLDATLRVQMRLEIARLHERIDTTMVYVTHDQTEAMTLADRIAVFRAGGIEQIGTPMQLYDTPANRFVAGFIGAPAMNFLPARIEDRDGLREIRCGAPGLPLGPAPAGLAPGAATLGIRPEHMHLVAPESGDVAARVEIVEKLGVETLAYLQTELGEDSLTLRASAEPELARGDRVGIRLDRDRIHLFDAGDRAWRNDAVTRPRPGSAPHRPASGPAPASAAG